MEFPDVQTLKVGEPAPAVDRADTADRDYVPATIPREAWRRHVETHKGTPALFAALPDGTPLCLTAAGVQFYEQLTGHLAWPGDFREACIFLWAASLTEAEQEGLWMPQAPIDGGNDPVIPGMLSAELLKRFMRWQRAVIPPAYSVALDVQSIAFAMWNHENGTAVSLDESALPDADESPEKKSPGVSSTGSSAPSMHWPEATSPAGPPFSSAPDTALSSPPTAHGSPPAASPS